MFEQLNKYERSTLALAAVLIAFVLFVAVNIFASATLKSAQLDLTQDSLYTLSPGTRSVLKSIDEPITLRFYLSHALTEQSPVHAQYGSRVRDLLERYTNIAHGKIKLEIYSPEPYSQDDDRAMAAGLQGIPLDNAGAVGYFGLVASNSTDDLQVIPFFNPDREQYLEYDLTKLIYSLANPKKPTIGLYTSLPLRADPKNQYQPWPIYKELAQFFTVKSLRGEGIVPADIDVLLSLTPRP
jgi:gliding motility-associatede transport system auxiliary component